MVPAGGVQDEVERARALLRASRRILVFSGAGLSTEAGVPDFRSEDGIWSRFDPDEFTFERLAHDPGGFWRQRVKLMNALRLHDVQPHEGHRALARLAGEPGVLGHVTQNIDGLLAVAGHPVDKLVELHGSAARVRCLACWRFFPYAQAAGALARGDEVPRCPACDGPLKPGTILFGEPLDEAALKRAYEWARHADLVLVLGSSLTVWPAADIPATAVARGAHLIVINRDATPLDGEADHILRTPLAQILPRLLS